jgi:hypothetical protein
VRTSLSYLLPDSERCCHFVSQLPGRLKLRLLDEPPRSCRWAATPSCGTSAHMKDIAAFLEREG